MMTHVISERNPSFLLSWGLSLIGYFSCFVTAVGSFYWFERQENLNYYLAPVIVSVDLQLICDVESLILKG